MIVHRDRIENICVFCPACIRAQERRWKEEYRCVSCKLHRKWKTEKVGEKDKKKSPTSKVGVTELKVENSMWRLKKSTPDLQLRRRARYPYATTTATRQESNPRILCYEVCSTAALLFLHIPKWFRDRFDGTNALFCVSVVRIFPKTGRYRISFPGEIS